MDQYGLVSPMPFDNRDNLNRPYSIIDEPGADNNSIADTAVDQTPSTRGMMAPVADMVHLHRGRRQAAPSVKGPPHMAAAEEAVGARTPMVWIGTRARG
jgi:hypothetical protein